VTVLVLRCPVRRTRIVVPRRVRVPASHLLGAENRGFVQVMQGFDYSRALIVLGLQIGDGTAQIMKLVIARHKAGRKGVAM
jgi:alkylation response protein AidB-like acyl-CoA dehydrogenase